jgi:uncharacterized membrane protein
MAHLHLEIPTTHPGGRYLTLSFVVALVTGVAYWLVLGRPDELEHPFFAVVAIVSGSSLLILDVVYRWRNGVDVFERDVSAIWILPTWAVGLYPAVVGGASVLSLLPEKAVIWFGCAPFALLVLAAVIQGIKHLWDGIY